MSRFKIVNNGSSKWRRKDKEIVLDGTESDLHLQLYFASTLFYCDSPDFAAEEHQNAASSQDEV